MIEHLHEKQKTQGPGPGKFFLEILDSKSEQITIFLFEYINRFLDRLYRKSVTSQESHVNLVPKISQAVRKVNVTYRDPS